MGNEVESSVTTEPQKKEKKSKTLLIIIVILLVLLIGTVAGATALLLSRDDSDKEDEVFTDGQRAYEVGVITSEEAARRAAEAAKVDSGSIALEMQVIATSYDGKNFSCYIANAAENEFDMYITIQLDDTDDLLYESGLVPVGTWLEDFSISTTLPVGEHDATVVFHQVDEDHITDRGSVAAGLTLSVRAQ